MHWEYDMSPEEEYGELEEFKLKRLHLYPWAEREDRMAGIDKEYSDDEDDEESDDCDDEEFPDCR